LWDDPPGSRPKRGRTRRAAERTVKAWRDTRKLDEADAVAVSLLYSAADLLDEARADPDESRYVRAMVLGRATDVVRFVVDRVAGDDGIGPSLADLLAEVGNGPHTGPAD
jgi:hypothetical protein